MKKIFLDTNFVMDLLARGDEGLESNAIKVLEIGKRRRAKFYVSFLTVANFAYIYRKQSRENLIYNLKKCCKLFEVISNDKSNILKAIKRNSSDFEDALQLESALTKKCDCILTRDPKGFETSPIPILSPLEFLESMK